LKWANAWHHVNGGKWARIGLEPGRKNEIAPTDVIGKLESLTAAKLRVKTNPEKYGRIIPVHRAPV
jgi:hypothetical protein